MFIAGVVVDEQRLAASEDGTLLVVESSEATRCMGSLSGLLPVEIEGKAGKSLSEKVGDIRENRALTDEAGLRLLPRSLPPKHEPLENSD